MLYNNTREKNLKILQYNVNKSEIKIMMMLLQNFKIASYDFLLIQKLWRNMYNNVVMSLKRNFFWMINNRRKKSYIYIYVNSRIAVSRISVISHENDLIFISFIIV